MRREVEEEEEDEEMKMGEKTRKEREKFCEN
jgi:hypothetical protein